MSIDMNAWLKSKGIGQLPTISVPAVAAPPAFLAPRPAPRPSPTVPQRLTQRPTDVLPQSLSMPVPTTTVVSLIPVVVGSVDAGEHGVWAALMAPGLRVAAVAISFAEAGAVTSGVWLPSSSHYGPPLDFGPLARWTGTACPEPVARLLVAGAPAISSPLAVAQQVLPRLGWSQPAQWLDVQVQLCSVNLNGDMDEVAAWLTGSTDVGPWSSMRHFTGVVAPQQPLAGVVRQAVVMTRLALGVAARCGTNLGTSAEDAAWAVDQRINARGLPIDRTLIRRIISMAPTPTAAAKFAEVETYACPDDRVRGVYGFLGQHTGRWTARRPAVHNLRKIHLPSSGQVEAIRNLTEGIRQGGEKLPHGDAGVHIGNLERPMFCAPEGMTFVVGDQKQAEPRGVFYFADLPQVLEIMDRVDLYLEPSLQAAMFGDAVEADHPDAGRRRTVLKIAIIACGFGMGGKKLKEYALDSWGFDFSTSGIDPARVVNVYRHFFAKVQKLWHAIGEQSVAAIGGTTPISTAVGTFEFVDGNLLSRLRSGRAIVYPRATVVEGKYGKVVEFWRGGPLRGRRDTVWGGVLFQNAVTGTLRDVHAGHLVELETSGMDPVGHCHDEAVCLVQTIYGQAALRAMAGVMSVAPDYLPGLRLRCVPYLSERLGAEGLRR